MVLPAKSGAFGEKDALMEHTPAPRSSKEEAASAAYRKRRLARYEKVRKLHEQGMSMMAICRTLGISRGAVSRYVQSDAFPEHR
jgi:DNA-binding NarL/FixJ family response regulator